MGYGTKAIFAKAAELLETKGWIQMAFARNEDGAEVPPWRRDATCFCMRGAIIASVYLLGMHEHNEVYAVIDLHQKLDAGAREDFGEASTATVSWNDEPGRTKEEVIALLRSAT